MSERNYKSVRFPACFPVAVLSIRAKNDLKEKGFISVYRLQSIMEESQGSQEGGSEAKTMEEQCLLAYLLWLELSQLSKQPRTLPPSKGDTYHSGPGPCKSINNQENAPSPYPQGNLIESSSIETPSD